MCVKFGSEVIREKVTRRGIDFVGQGRLNDLRVLEQCPIEFENVHYVAEEVGIRRELVSVVVGEQCPNSIANVLSDVITRHRKIFQTVLFKNLQMHVAVGFAKSARIKYVISCRCVIEDLLDGEYNVRVVIVISDERGIRMHRPISSMVTIETFVIDEVNVSKADVCLGWWNLSWNLKSHGRVGFVAEIN